MQLNIFLEDLWASGAVKVSAEIHEFDEDDLLKSLALLKDFYKQDKLTMPYQAPDFSPYAAVWGAKYVYTSAQLTLLRDLDDEEVQKSLPPFLEKKSPEAIYSADLTLRYLPDVLAMARGLAPGDILVQCMKNAAIEWPFSSVGMDLLEDPDTELILKNQSLKYAYVDRIIEARDTKRARLAPLKSLITEIMGEYTDKLWPEFAYLIDEVNGE